MDLESIVMLVGVLKAAVGSTCRDDRQRATVKLMPQIREWRPEVYLFQSILHQKELEQG